MRDDNSPLTTRTAHLLVMGQGRVGKSASIVRFTTGRFIYSYSQSTRDWLYRRRLDLDDSQVSIELLELDDQQQEVQKLVESEKFMWANAFVIIYSLTSKKSFDRAKEYLETVIKFCETIKHQNQQQFPILILANKSDLSPAARQVSFDQGIKLATNYNCLFGEMSVLKTSNALDALITELVKQLEFIQLDQSRSWACHECGAEKCLARWSVAANFQSIPLVPVESNIVRTRLAPVNSLAQLTSKGGRVQSMRASAPVSKAVVAATVAFCRPLLSKSSSLAATTTAATSTTNQTTLSQMAQIQTVTSPNPMIASSTLGKRSLRSSFKKASLAIVGNKTLAFKKNQQTPKPSQENNGSSAETLHQSVSSLNSDDLSSVATTKAPNWIKSRLTSSLTARGQQQQQLTTKRSLFKYKDRLQTVAFEPGFISSDETNQPSKPSEEHPIESASLNSLPVVQDSKQIFEAPPRPMSSYSSGHQSNSSLASRPESRCVSSTVFNSVAPALTSGPRAVLNKLNHRKDSRSTLSRASTSGGSYGDDEDDENDDEVGPLGEERIDFPNMWPEQRQQFHQQPAIERVYLQTGGCSISEAPKVSTMSFCKALIKAARGGQSKTK